MTKDIEDRAQRSVYLEDMQKFGVTEEDPIDRVRWRHMIRCGDL